MHKAAQDGEQSHRHFPSAQLARSPVKFGPKLSKGLG